MNSELYGNFYRIPTPIIMRLNAKLVTSPDGDGIKRAKNLVKGGMVSYQQLKRLKNFFDYYNPQTGDENKYEFAGGKEMQDWVESILGTERSSAEISKETQSTIDTANATDDMKPQGAKIDIHEADGTDKHEGLQKNSLAVIFNLEKRILLLKRSSFPDQWMPNKWSLVGGMVEEGEDPMDACKREIKEETGLVINALIEKVVMQRNEDSVEHIFVGKYDGDPFNIKIDKENQGYGWFGVKEIDFLDTVPNLMDYINITLIDYE